MIIVRIPGGWRVHNIITDGDIKVLKTALNGLVSADYEPEMLATQVVNGTNYCFICKLRVLSPNGPEGIAKIMIYKPLAGEPIIKSIESIL
ncbi:hypothetical protein [Clostridium chromiireducens]|uniref:hypothetical protein n=1 Tax=Clostridium chromiireducens TaxID=225345 RepID=UPI001FA92D91|nr:hypothetical protein [Clostridium chromiireducens]